MKSSRNGTKGSAKKKPKVINGLEETKRESESDYSPPMDLHNKRPSYLDAGASSSSAPSSFNENVIVNLESQFLKVAGGLDGLDSEPIKTYLRIRPYLTLAQAEPQILTIIDEKTIIANSAVPGFRRQPKKTEYKFTKVLGPECAQLEVYEQAIAPLMNHLERGDNCLVFSYGATNSGKTYTMQGSSSQYGIIPRTLDHIFNKFQDRLYKGADIQPFMFESTRALSEDEKKLAQLKKAVLLDAASKTTEMRNRVSVTTSVATSASSHCESFKQIAGPQLHDGEYSSYDGHQSNMVCLWVSFVELYNEKCYDLLDHVEVKGKGKRKELRVVTDKGGHLYMRDVTELPIFNEEEAYAIYVAGYKKLQVGSTKANKSSSRSHCFFTIQVVELGVTKEGVVFPMKTYRMTFCDLAGVERVSQTENTGEQLLESSSINKSLLSLLKVIRMIREKQSAANGRQILLEQIPFRESKLTRIFQGYFKSSTHIAMIVNVNPNPVMMESTIQTLQNSAIASNIIAYRPAMVPKIVVSNRLNCSSFLHSSIDLEDVMEESEEDDIRDLVVLIPAKEKIMKPLRSNKPPIQVQARAMTTQVVDIFDSDGSDKENDEQVSTVVQNKQFSTIIKMKQTIAKQEKELKQQKTEIKSLNSKLRTVVMETKEEMVKLYSQGLMQADLERDEWDKGKEELLKSQKKCNEYRSLLADKNVKTTSCSTQTEEF